MDKKHMDNKTIPTFGNGRYSGVMKEFYGDALRLLGLSEQQAERAARTLGNDLGRAQTAVTGVKIGTPRKADNIVTVKDVGSGYKGHMTYSIGLCKACALLQEARKYGIQSHGEVEITPIYLDWLNIPAGTAEQPKEPTESK